MAIQEEVKNKIIDLYGKGITLSKAAQECNVSVATVQKYWKQLVSEDPSSVKVSSSSKDNVARRIKNELNFLSKIKNEDQYFYEIINAIGRLNEAISCDNKSKAKNLMRVVCVLLQSAIVKIETDQNEDNAQKKKRDSFLMVARACIKTRNFEEAKNWIENANCEFLLNLDQRKEFSEIV